jgi:glycine C-acetyltransferase
MYQYLEEQTTQIQAEGLFKKERIISSPQDAVIRLADGQEVINFCANNYLGLANHPSLIKTAEKTLHDHGFGMASVRFICGTQDIHKNLEQKISHFLEMEDAILYSSCFDANTGLFETILNENDAIISDALNHASVIDGVRLCKAKRYVYANNNMTELEEKLKEAKDARFRLIATDGVFSMDGIIANLKDICDLADQYDAMVMVDDSHAVGFTGLKGKGTPEHCGVMGRIDILTGTLGKALGGASGGYTAGKKSLITWLRQRSRPYLFSNATAPCITAAGITAIDILESSDTLRERLRNNSTYFRAAMTEAGFKLVPGEHAIIPVMLGDAKLATELADKLLKKGIYVIGFSFPVVPKGQARIRTQMSAAHTTEHLDKAIAAFIEVGRECGVI